MSLFQSEAIGLALCPGGFGVARRAQSSSVLCEELAAEQAADHPDWVPAFTALSAWMEKESIRAMRADLTLSAHYARFCLVPWTDKRLSKVDEQAWVRLHFEAAYGDMTGWQMAAEAGDYGQSQFACAVPLDLSTHWLQLCRSRRLTGGTLKPYFLHVWNHWRRRARPGQLWGIAESDRIVWAEVGSQGWRSLRAAAVRTEVGKLPTLANREQRLLGREGPIAVVLHVPGQPGLSAQAEDTRVDWLALPGQDPSTCKAMARMVGQT